MSSVCGLVFVLRAMVAHKKSDKARGHEEEEEEEDALPPHPPASSQVKHFTIVKRTKGVREGPPPPPPPAPLSPVLMTLKKLKKKNQKWFQIGSISITDLFLQIYPSHLQVFRTCFLVGFLESWIYVMNIKPKIVPAEISPSSF